MTDSNIKWYFSMSKILIVEGDAAQQILLEVEISEMGHFPILAKDDVEAIKKFHQYHPELVILDLQQPYQDGFIALHSLLSATLDIPVIIHTACSHFQQHDLNWRAEAYLIKSSDLGELKRNISRILSNSIKKSPKSKIG